MEFPKWLLILSFIFFGLGIILMFVSIKQKSKIIDEKKKDFKDFKSFVDAGNFDKADEIAEKYRLRRATGFIFDCMIYYRKKIN